MEYPFEDMGEMLVLWTRDNVIEILNCLKRVDQYYGINAVRVLSENYSKSVLSLNQKRGILMNFLIFAHLQKGGKIFVTKNVMWKTE